MLQRLFSLLLTLIGVVTLVFFLIHLIPGDPVEAMLGDSARVADREALHHKLGLDQPLAVQYSDYIKSILQLDLGTSLRNQQSVSSLLLERLPATAWLAFAALLIAVTIAVPLGVIAARRQGSAWDTGAMMVSLFGVSMPNFWLGPMLILLFSLWLGWTPVSGMESFWSIILPAVTLGASLAAVLARMVRSSLLETLGEDYVRTALAKGLDESTVVWRHALRNAMLPVITLLGLQLGALLGGAVITETVFSWPGIGSLMVEAIQQRDYPVVQGCVLLIALIYVLVNAGTDLVYRMVDPRIALTGEE
ncbi:glutathione ABC transporter permease GsiC [Solemya velum gill symbiont]|uniref:nickel ABC transporter permease n=1 Tax=Solemya velum gill symbiont TaxID=2340 RepID=UPI00099700B4|nr:nickel ABC transporter permease [Solemya velum gill symbiont]OOZ75689.1 glutathione ABC transporter permease GsiC [Solemya velum gill symbiont]